MSLDFWKPILHNIAYLLPDISDKKSFFILFLPCSSETSLRTKTRFPGFSGVSAAFLNWARAAVGRQAARVAYSGLNKISLSNAVKAAI